MNFDLHLYGETPEELLNVLAHLGHMDSNYPPSRNLYCGSAFTRMNGTGLVVCAVHGSPVS